MAYIVINNWEKFQHYKDRNPTWIKLLIEIIEEFDAEGNPKKFFLLPDSAKLTFVLLLCLRAKFDRTTGKIPYKNDKNLKRMLGINRLTLQPLVNAGFITVDTNAVSILYQDGTETLHQSKRESKSKRTEKECFLFDRFWEKYPRKDAKQRAVDWFSKNKPAQEDVDKMIYTIEQQSRGSGRLHCRERRFIPLPTTWLNDGDWRDAPTKSSVEQKKAEDETAAQEKKRQEMRAEHGQFIREADEKKLITVWRTQITLRPLINELRPEIAGKAK